MKKLLIVTGTILMLSACNQSPKEEKDVSGKVDDKVQQNQENSEKNSTKKVSKLYSVDEFVQGGFKDGNKLHINIKSVTCYNSSCGVEGGGKWGVGMSEIDSKDLFQYAGKGVDMVIQADPDCDATEATCSKIKNVSIVK